MTVPADEVFEETMDPEQIGRSDARARVLKAEFMAGLIETGDDDAVIRGTGISVYQIAALTGRQTVDEIMEDYPSLGRAQVEAAVAHAEAHPMTGRAYPAVSMKRALADLVEQGVFDNENDGRGCGSTLDGFLAEEGIGDQVSAEAERRVSDWKDERRKVMDAFDEIASGVVAATKARGTIISIVREHDDVEVAERAYEALRGVTWRILTQTGSDDEIPVWQDAVLRVRGIMKRRGSEIAERFTVLSDLLGQSARFREIHSPEEVRGRAVAMSTLALLAQSPRAVSLSELASAAGLPTRSASAMMYDLSSAGFTRHDGLRGEDTAFSITPEGRALLRT